MALELFFVSARTNKRHHHQNPDAGVAEPNRLFTELGGVCKMVKCVADTGRSCICAANFTIVQL